MTERYKYNPACAEKRQPRDLLATFSTAEIKAFRTMTSEEVAYLVNECCISEYVAHLRKGHENSAVGEDYPILVVKGTQLQLERFKMAFLLTLLDYQGFKYFYPSDFGLGEEALEEMRKYTGVAIVKIVKGASTTEGLDNFRTELISSVLAARRDYFNPTLILTEESISGKFNVTNELTKVVMLDATKLRTSYDGKVVQFNDAIASRAKFVNTKSNEFYVPKQETSAEDDKSTTSTDSYQNNYKNNYNNSYKSSRRGTYGNKKNPRISRSKQLRQDRGIQ